MGMKIDEKEMAERRQRHLEGLKLHEIEDMPLSAEQVAMFEMFDREGFTDEQCRAYILERALKRKNTQSAGE